MFQIFFFECGAGRNNFDDFALGKPLAVFRQRNLFANGDFFTQPQKARDIYARSMIGNAAHRAFAAMRQSKIQKAGYFNRIAVEHFVKIAQPEKQHFRRILCFYLPVLRH